MPFRVFETPRTSPKEFREPPRRVPHIPEASKGRWRTHINQESVVKDAQGLPKGFQIVHRVSQNLQLSCMGWLLAPLFESFCQSFFEHFFPTASIQKCWLGIGLVCSRIANMTCRFRTPTAFAMKGLFLAFVFTIKKGTNADFAHPREKRL